MELNNKLSTTLTKEELINKNAEQEKEIFDLHQLLEISKSLNSFLEFDRLIEAILYGVMAQLKTLSVAIYTKKAFDENIFVLHRDNYGFDINREILGEIATTHPLLDLIHQSSDGISKIQIKNTLKADRVVQEILRLNATFFVPLIAKNRLIGFLILGERMEGDAEYTAYEKCLISDIASLGAIAINNSQLLEMTTTDIMTRLKLKHYFYTVLAERLENINTDFLNKKHLSVLMFDIDFFKKVNDTYGHEAGDIVLTKVASIIKSSTRSSDIAARYGGEEFVLMLAGSSVIQAKEVAERIRQEVERTVIVHDGREIKVTISIGIAGYLFDWEKETDLVKRADKALYQSKENGRNRVTISENNLTKNR